MKDWKEGDKAIWKGHHVTLQMEKLRGWIISCPEDEEIDGVFAYHEELEHTDD